MAEQEIYYIYKNDWPNFLATMTSLYNVLAPEQGLFDPEYSSIPSEKTERIVFPGARLTRPLKFFLYPPKEDLLSDPLPQNKKSVILGVKACDLRAAAILDHIFLDPDYIDPFYKSRRDNIIIISDDCPEPRDCCFCVLVGMNPFPEKGFDLNLSFLEDGTLVEVGSEKGKDLIRETKINLQQANPEQIKRRNENRQKVIAALKEANKDFSFPLDNLPSLLEENYENPEWKEACKTCVSCCACTNICPSCHCFLLIQDTGAGDNKKTFEMLRSWDSCQSTGFSRVAGGANPKKRLHGRFANRFHCKLQYKPRNYSIFACTGCGRCFEACQGKIDVRQVLTLLAKQKVE
jgi:hypothetical protein